MKKQASVLESYLEQRGVTLLEENLSCKVVIPNPNFRYVLFIFATFSIYMFSDPYEVCGRVTILPPKYNILWFSSDAKTCVYFSTMHAFPSEVITYEEWKHLKPVSRKTLSGWVKGALWTGKEMQEASHQKLNFILGTAPMWDRSERDIWFS